MASDQYTAQGYYTSSWASLYSIEFPPEVYNEWFQRYGKGFKILDFLRMFGKEQTIAQRTFYVYEDATDQRVATVGTGGISTAAAGVHISFRLDAGDYDTNNNGPLRDNFAVLIPKAYQAPEEDRWYVVTTHSGTGASTIYTAYPLSDDSEVDATVPAGTELMIGFSVYAAGTGQPAGMASGTYRRTYYTHIAKESCGFEGGQIAARKYREVITKAGTPGLFDKGTIETEFRLDQQIDTALFLGEENSNNLTQTAALGGTNNRLGTKGLWNWQLELGQGLSYVDNFDMDYFDQVKPLLQSQGVVDSTVGFLVGPNLIVNLENNVLDAVKEWSGGSDLLSESNKAFNANIKTVMKNGVKFYIGELASFANPNRFGITSYDFKDAGMIIPMGMVTVSEDQFGSSKITVPNVAICYYDHAGENRKRIVDTVAGLNGMGYKAVDEYDRTQVWMLSEFACFAANVNQHIQVTKA